MQVTKHLRRRMSESKLQPGVSPAIGSENAPPLLPAMTTNSKYQPARGRTKTISALGGLVPTGPIFVPAERVRTLSS